MGFTASKVATLEEIKQEQIVNSPSLDLTKEQVEILLILIKQSHFKGEQVQNVYDLVVKLQEYYLKLL